MSDELQSACRAQPYQTETDHTEIMGSTLAELVNTGALMASLGALQLQTDSAANADGARYRGVAMATK